MIKTTQNLNEQTYKDALSIRQRVFVVEQGVPESLEIDENEAKTVHFVLYDNDQPIATLRLLPDKEAVLVQRFAVEQTFRKQGFGALLLEFAEDYAKNNHYPKILLHAQIHASEFYQKQGYVKAGEEFIEADIRHVTMEKMI